MAIKITVEISGGVLEFVYASGDTPEETSMANAIEVTLLDHDEMEKKEILKLKDFANDKQICVW